MKKWLKIIFVIITFALISVAAYFILKACGITNINNLKEIINKSKGLAVLVYILLSSLILTLLCFVPLLNTSLAILAITIFPIHVAFLSCLTATLFANTLLFFVGDKLGEKFATKLISKQELESAQNLIDKKSKILLPILFVLPGVPDEALCIVAGMTKMKYSYLIITSAVYHTLEIGLFCFCGSGLINWSALSLFDWILLINILIVDLHFLFRLEKNIKK